MKVSRIAAICVAVGLLSSCATPYQPAGLTGGFAEQKVSDSAYWVAFSGNGHTSKDRVWLFWFYRCAELTQQKGYRYFMIRVGERPAAVSMDTPRFQPAVYHPDDARADLIKTHSSGGAPIYIPYGGGGGATQWTANGTVLMFGHPLPDELPWAIDAQVVLDLLGEYVRSNGKSAMPAKDTLMQSASIGHANVVFGDDLKAAVASDASAGTGEARGAQEIKGTVEFMRPLIYTAFNEHRLRVKDDAGGRVTVEFKVSPNGIVSVARVVSSSFTDDKFNDAIVAGLTRLPFAPTNSAMTSVSNLVIDITKRTP